MVVYQWMISEIKNNNLIERNVVVLEIFAAI